MPYIRDFMVHFTKRCLWLLVVNESALVQALSQCWIGDRPLPVQWTVMSKIYDTRAIIIKPHDNMVCYNIVNGMTKKLYVIGQTLNPQKTPTHTSSSCVSYGVNFVSILGKNDHVIRKFDCTTLHWVNSIWSSDTIWPLRSGSTLAQVMAWCLTAQSHYLNQCCLVNVIMDVLWHSPESSFTWMLLFCIRRSKIMPLESLSYVPGASELNNLNKTDIL